MQQWDLWLVDGDVVEAKNVGRPLFGPGDVNVRRPKSEVLAERMQHGLGLSVMHSCHFIDALNLIVGAVDSLATRALIARAVETADGRLQ